MENNIINSLSQVIEISVVLSGIFFILRLIITKFIEYQKEKLEFNHQTTFKTLHEKRAEVIAELYGKMIDTKSAIRTFSFSLLKQSEYNQSEEDARNKLSEFAVYFEKNKIYLSQETCNSVSILLNINGKIWIDISAPNPFQDNNDNFKDVYARIDKDLDSSLKIVETEFRKLLGTNN